MKTTRTLSRSIPAEIERLDLDCVLGKILDHDKKEAKRRDGTRLWSKDRAVQAIAEYRQFLALMFWYPNMVLVPSEDIDEIWHCHLLNSKKYRVECELIFGRFQDHFPTFGQSEEVLSEHAKDRDQTIALFKDEFGDVPASYNKGVYLDSGGACYGCSKCRRK